MSPLNKAMWSADQNKVSLSMPLTKIDVENRLVSGFATLDNTDMHDEIVTAEASRKAFERFRGALREMHQPIAAGHMVSFTQEPYYDTVTQKFYDGIYVTVYVSKGAPLTWEKVVDNTLSGFSIGGEILEASSEYVPELEKTIRFIKDYELIELSLVDNPANQLCNVFSITKSADGNIIKGMIVDTKTENVFYCRTDEIAKTSTEETLKCPNCETTMEQAGWFEYNDTNRSEKLADVVQKYLAQSDNTQAKPANNEGGVDVVVEDTVEKVADVTEEVPDVVEAVVEVEVETEVVEKSAEVETPVDEAADVSEVPDAETEMSKMLEDLKTSLTESIEAGQTSILEKALGEVETRFGGVAADIEEKFSKYATQLEELTTRLAGLEERVSPVEKSLEVLEGSTALRKSSDLGGSTEAPVEKSNESIWGGKLTFLGADSLSQE